MPELHLYGPPRLLLDEGAELALSAREAALLAWLSMEGPTARARVAGLLWPLGSESQARANLRQTLSRLRKSAGPLVQDQEGILSIAGGVAIAAKSQRLLLDGAEPPDAQGFAEWLAARREQDHRDAQRDALARGQAALGEGDLDAALEAADAALRTAPEAEEAWRLRMRVFAQRGDRASALQAWDECRLALRQAFGVTPSADTEALGQALLQETIRQSVPGSLPRQLMRPDMMIGRGNELETARQCLLVGHAVVVSGPAGMGKSRFLAEAMRVCGDGLLAGARPGDHARPGALMARLVSGLLQRFHPQLDAQDAAHLRWFLPAEAGVADPPGMASALDQQRVLASVAKAIAQSAAQGLRCIAIDDIHFADDASLVALLHVIGEWAADMHPPVAWLLGARAGEVEPAGTKLIDAVLRSGRAARVELTPLAPDEVASLVAELDIPKDVDRATLARSLHESLGGNPSYMLESLKLMWTQHWASWRSEQAVPIPPSVRESVRRRLSALSADALAMAQLAAVAQRDFSGLLASSVLDRGMFELAGALAPLQQEQLFDGERFAHDLIAEEVRRTLPDALVKSLHARVAQALMPLRGSEAGVAWHLTCAGDLASAAPWQQRTAESLRRAWQMSDAAHAFEAAAKGFVLAGDSSAAMAAWRQAARCWIVISCSAAALAALDEAEAHARTARERFQVRTTRATALYNAGLDTKVAEGAQALLEALNDGDFQASPEDAGQALLSAALAAPYMREPKVLIAACEAVRARGVTDEKFARRIDYCEAITWGWMAHPLRQLPLLERAWDSAAQRRDFGELINIGNQLVRCAESRGDLSAALEACERTLWAIRQAGAGPGFEADLASHHALLAATAHQHDTAHSQLGRWLELREDMAQAGGYEVLRHAMTLWWCGGNRTDVVGVLERARAMAGDGTTPFCAHVHWASLRLLEPDAAQARELLARSDACCASPDGLVAMRHRVMASKYGHGDAGDAAPLREELQARGLHGLRQALATGDDDAATSASRDPWCG